jgi:phosphoglycolate phosphatase
VSPTVPVTLACLDLAGTTVRDDGAVETAFVRAAERVADAHGALDLDAAVAYVRTTMGQSKIEVFRHLYGRETAARAANEAFETAYAELVSEGAIAPIPGAPETFRVLRELGVRLCFTTGFAPATRDLLLEALGWQGVAELALSPADTPLGRGRPFPDMVLTAVLRLGIDDVRAVAVAGDTTSDLWAGWRSGAGIVAGVLTGAHDRATLSSAPHTHLLHSVADLAAVIVG